LSAREDKAEQVARDRVRHGQLWRWLEERDPALDGILCATFMSTVSDLDRD
jgi:hypothetical protein